MRYRSEGVPLGGLRAARNTAPGSSRDWAAKGPQLLGVKFVVARGFERIHRTNLIMMGILPLPVQRQRQRRRRSASTARETFDLDGRRRRAQARART